MAYVYLNGEYLSEEGPLLSTQDRGFLLGDGLFETLRYCNEIHFFEEHFTRLRTSAKEFLIPFLYTSKGLKDICIEVVKRNQLADAEACVRITLSRGPSGRGIDIPKSVKPTLCISAVAYQTVVKPISLYVTTIRRQSNSVLANHKTLNYLDSIMARTQARQRGFDDSLILNEKTHIACTSAANIFFVKEGNIITPAITSGILPGIMRQHIINLCQEQSISVEEIEIDLELMLQCDEVFITNSLIGVQSVIKIDQREFGAGANTMAEHLRSSLLVMTKSESGG